MPIIQHLCFYLNSTEHSLFSSRVTFDLAVALNLSYENEFNPCVHSHANQTYFGTEEFLLRQNSFWSMAF